MRDHEIGEAGQLPPARFGAVTQLREHWQGLCEQHGGPPPSSALDPEGLGPLIEDLFIAERIGRGLLRLRVAGRNLSALAGVDMQGLPLSALFTPEARMSFASLVEEMFRERQPVETGLRTCSGYGRQILNARLLLLPLALPRLGPAVLLGCLATERPETRLAGLRYSLDPAEAPAAPRPELRRPQLVVDQPWIARRGQGASRGMLRLVSSRS